MEGHERVARLQTHPAPPAALRVLEEAYEHACLSRPGERHDVRYRFAGRPVHMSIVGEDLARYTARSFAHLREDADEASPILEVGLWNEQQPDSFLPSEPPERTWEQVFDGVLSSYSGGRYLEYRRPGSITWYDRTANRILGWRSSGTALSVDEFSKPLPAILMIWYYDQGVHVVHSGLVAWGNSAALIGGKGGSGKTTTSIMSGLGGLGFLGDDHVGLEQLADGSFAGHSLYNCVRLAPDNIVRFPELVPHSHDYFGLGEEKYLTFFADVMPEQLQRTTPITAVVLPRLSGGARTTFSPAAKGEALMRLAPSSITMPFRTGAEGFSRLSDLVRSVPCYWLDLSPDVREVPSVMKSLLSEAVMAGERHS